MADALVRETQKLYGLPLSEFTAARNTRAKELRKDDPELAEAVSALPKPSVAAAALNELVREDPSEVRALVQSGKRLRQAQEAAVSGKKGADLNAAVQEHRAALDRVQRDLRRRKLELGGLEPPTSWVRSRRKLLQTLPTLCRFVRDVGILQRPFAFGQLTSHCCRHGRLALA